MFLPLTLKLENFCHPPAHFIPCYAQSSSFHRVPQTMTKHHARPISSPSLSWQPHTPMELCISYSFIFSPACFLRTLWQCIGAKNCSNLRLQIWYWNPCLFPFWRGSAAPKGARLLSSSSLSSASPLSKFLFVFLSISSTVCTIHVGDKYCKLFTIRSSQYFTFPIAQLHFSACIPF